MRLVIIARHPEAKSGSGGDTHSTPLRFVHGMFHEAWCWDAHFLGFFARHGFAAYAVSLRGHDAPGGVLPSSSPPEKVRTPMLVLGAARDNMLETRWEAVASRILAWLRSRGL